MALQRKPQAGDLIRWPSWAPGRTARVVRTPAPNDDLCWIEYASGQQAPFIWRFREGLNREAEIIEGEP